MTLKENIVSCLKKFLIEYFNFFFNFRIEGKDEFPGSTSNQITLQIQLNKGTYYD